MYFEIDDIILLKIKIYKYSIIVDMEGIYMSMVQLLFVEKRVKSLLFSTKRFHTSLR